MKQLVWAAFGTCALFLAVSAAPAHAGWAYTTTTDEFTDSKMRVATLESESFKLGDASGGAAVATLRIRQSSKDGLSVWVKLSSGQFAMPASFNVMARFDDREPMKFWTAGAASHDTAIFFIPSMYDSFPGSKAPLESRAFDNYAERFVSEARKATRVRFEVQVYRAGTRVLDFRSEPIEFELERPAPRAPKKKP